MSLAIGSSIVTPSGMARVLTTCAMPLGASGDGDGGGVHAPFSLALLEGSP